MFYLMESATLEATAPDTQPIEAPAMFAFETERAAKQKMHEFMSYQMLLDTVIEAKARIFDHNFQPFGDPEIYRKTQAGSEVQNV